MTIGGQRPAGPRGAAAADYLAALLRGPRRSGEVMAVRTGAALVAMDTDSPGRMIALADSSVAATRTANTVLLSPGPRPALGAAVLLGGGAVLLDGLEHRVGRFWRSGVRALTVDPAVLAELTDVGTPGLPVDAVEPLLAALRTGYGLAAAARSSVGRGPGSTPAGDDLLAGVALGLRVTARHPLLDELHAAITPDLADRTTALSADLLRAALAGHASPEVLSLVRTLRPGAAPADRRQALDAVLRLGHTSGADLLLGLSAALRSALPSPPPGPHPTRPAQPRRMVTR